ncbi:DnaB-like helicase N-terminal domain-containing protein [Flexibacterium corallicola]|uniref:DnaB-like helicase N-terminal domain-containing protein n=1 Tax=Flexibacterium corallicola TaxID=3037259 RepID=UPI00286F7C47|nr:DnaB-like helicase N-terminal domain-containing protein [Pseudovibrio sp. M1P-2-3]
MNTLVSVEQQALARLLGTPDLYWEVADTLSPEHFFDPIWKAVWIGLSSCLKEGGFDLHLVEAGAPYQGEEDLVARLW